MRSSSKHPTLELRAPDVCTFAEDAIAIASLYRCLARHLYERSAALKPLSTVDRAIAVENKWRAQRYGTECIFATRDGPVGISTLLTSLTEQLSEDAATLGCTAEIENCKRILARGSSADRQLSAYHSAGNQLPAALEWIASNTVPDRPRRQPPLWQQAIV
jgi:carboxylate-amine ligase